MLNPLNILRKPADPSTGRRAVVGDAVIAEASACLRDASLPPSEFVQKYLPGMFSESATEDVRAELASIMSDLHPGGFRLMATALAHADTRDLLPNVGSPLCWSGVMPMRGRH